MSTSTSADERESVEEVASKEIREADRDETETVDNADDDDDDDENKDSPKNIKTGNSKSKEEEEEEEKEEVVANQEEGAEQEKSQEEPKEETGKSEDNDGVEPKDATAADDGPRFEENDESTTHDSDAASEDTEGPEEGFDEDPANSKVSLGGLVTGLVITHCANLPCVHGHNQFINTKFTRPFTKTSKSTQECYHLTVSHLSYERYCVTVGRLHCRG